MAPTCGDARPDVSAITGTEGLVIARDGTLYYSQPGGVGRLVPGGTPEDAWAAIGSGGSTVWGMVLDESNANLYVGSPSTGAIHRVEVATATATVFVDRAGQPNGLTLGPDGALYFSDFEAGQVYRVELGGATGTASAVTTSEIASANGVAFFPDGDLLVASYGGGQLFRLTLTDGVETGRETFASLGMRAAADGLAFDAEGRVYVTQRQRLTRLEADGSGPMDLLVDIPNAANLDFGSGALDCEDIYVTSLGGPMRRYEMGTTPGAPVPWH
jgi:sugar lactone lactonase YvrE